MKLLPPEKIARVRGFGMAAHADGYLFEPTSVDEIKAALELARTCGRQVTLRGAGRSYGDANIGSECVVIDLCRMNRILSWDAESGLVDCEAGVTIEMVWRRVLPDSYWPPVVSGTMFPTLGGALAMNIHGKNNFAVGTLGEHVVELDLLTADGGMRTLRPTDPLFRAVISGFGSLGVITRVELQMKPVASGDLRVLGISAGNWDEQFRAFEEHQGTADYMVSWVDCFGRGAGSGRGLFHAAWYGPSDPQGGTLKATHQDLPAKVLGVVPKSLVWRVLRLFCNRTGMRLLNWAKYLSSRFVGNRREHVQSLVAFSFLLDYVPNWRNAYLPSGFIQYQSFVPRERAPEVFKRQIEMQQAAKLEAYLGVLKRHRPDPFLFSHGVDGYSMALDFKVTPQTWPKLLGLCHRMNDLVLEAGGRFYFAKDSTLRPEDVERFLGQEALARYRELKQCLDPEGLFTSNLMRRLDL